MSIDYTLLAIAVVLLYFPRQWLRWGKQVLKSEKHSRRGDSNDFDPSRRREMGDPEVIASDEFAKGRNYVDFLRAVAGSAVVLGTAYSPSCLTALADGAGASERTLVLLRCAIVFGATLVQVFRFEKRFTLYAPIFFLGGITFGFLGWPAAFAFALVWAFNLGFPNASTFLFAHAVLALVFGLVFAGINRTYAAAAFGCLFFPVLVSLLSKRALQTFHRRS